MLTKILLGLGTLMGIFLIYIALQPSDYEISRSQIIQAKPEKIFPYLNNPKQMNSWNPWTLMETKAVMNYTGPEEGVGARNTWENGKQLGTGSATITESQSHKYVRVKLEYQKPMEMSQDAEFYLKEVPNGTEVTWAVKGKNTFVGRIFCFFMNMNDVVGKTFAKGLLNLKSKVED